MLIPMLLTCYFRLRDGLRGKGEETFLDELRMFGFTFFVNCCIYFFIEFLSNL